MNPEQKKDQMMKGDLLKKEDKNSPFSKVLAEFPELAAQLQVDEENNKKLLQSIQAEYDFLHEMIKKRSEVDPSYQAPKAILDKLNILQEQSLNVLNGETINLEQKPGKIKLGMSPNAPEVFEDSFNLALEDPQRAKEMIEGFEDPEQRNEAIQYLSGVMGKNYVNLEPTPMTQPPVAPIDEKQVGSGGNSLLNLVKNFLQERGLGASQSPQSKVSEMSSSFKSAVNKDEVSGG